MMMRVPRPGALSTPIVPHVHHQPPHDREAQPGAALLRSGNRKISPAPSDVMPRPVSSTVMRTACSPSRRIAAVEIVIRPGFPSRLSTALATRFSRMRRKAIGSPRTDVERASQIGFNLDALSRLRGGGDVDDQRVEVAAPVAGGDSRA